MFAVGTAKPAWFWFALMSNKLFFFFFITSFFILCKPLLRINQLKPKYSISENSLSTSPFLFLSTSPFFCCFCLILISVWFYFVLQRATGRKLGFSERVVRIFISPYLAVLCRLRELNPSSSIPPFPGAEIPSHSTPALS